jgi:hypothetical protein
MDWAEVVARLERTGHVVDGEDDWRGLIFEREDGGRQRVAVKRSQDGSRVVVMCQVCAVRHIDPVEALRYNSVVDNWSLSVEDGVYVLRSPLLLPTLPEAELDQIIAAQRAEATRIRQRQIPDTLSDAAQKLCVSTFAHWSG